MASGSTAADVMGQLSALLASAERATIAGASKAPIPAPHRPLRVAIDRQRRRAHQKIKGAQALTAEIRPFGRCCVHRASSKVPPLVPKVAFLYQGLGSQYVNMLAELREERAGRSRDLRRSRPAS